MSFKSQPPIRKGTVVPLPIVKLRPLSDCNQECNLLNRRVSRRSQLQTGSKITGVVIGNGDTISSTDHSVGKVFTTLNALDISGCIGNSYDATYSKINKSDDTGRQQVKAQTNLCHHCNEGFQPQEPMVNLNGLVWHKECFVCAQCFQQFSDDLFFEFGGRLYCSHDFQILFAPFCTSCKEFIMGRVIKAMNGNWHPQCFLCSICSTQLADVGFVRNANRALCKACNEEERIKRVGKHVCAKCNNVVEETELLRYKGEVFHPYHFRCQTCSCELTSTARVKDNELYCLRCHDKLGIPICGACRRPIEERVIHALGKTWHVEHFVCSHCEKPFLGSRHYERKGLAYCENHYHQLFGNTCFHCNNVITGNAFSAFNKNWCENHFSCFCCNHKMDHKTKFMEFDGKPTCKNCYKKFPSELLKRHKKEAAGKK